VAQFPPEQVVQLEPEPVRDSPLEETEKLLNSFDTLSLSQEGHSTFSSLPRIRTSKTERQSLQEYS
jgi:hypothetical protein